MSIDDPPELVERLEARGFRSLPDLARRKIFDQLEDPDDQRRAIERWARMIRRGSPAASELEDQVAELLGAAPQALWPRRYSADGVRLVLRHRGPKPDQPLSQYLRDEHGITMNELRAELPDAGLGNIYALDGSDAQIEPVQAIAAHLGVDERVIWGLVRRGAPRQNEQGRLERALHAQAEISVTDPETGEVVTMRWTKHPWHTLMLEGWTFTDAGLLRAPPPDRSKL